MGVYCVANSLANSISDAIGVQSSAAFVFNLLLTVALFTWTRKKGLTKYYGLCGADAPAGRFLWYIPLLLFMSNNLWFGIDLNVSLPDAVCHILNMLCVGFLEEMIFRGFLFRTLEKDDPKKAIVISSVTFGLGRVLNLFNGNGMDITANLLQIVAAVACGFLFVVIYYRGGSLIPCIVAHAVNNAVSVFANEAGITLEKRLLSVAAVTAIVILYALILCKTLPQKQKTDGE